MKMLICVSRLPYAEATLMFGGLIAKTENYAVTLMTVVTDETERPLAEEVLAKAQTVMPGLQAGKKICYGSPATGILGQANTGEYDMIVIGAHALGGFFDRFVTSVMKKVVTNASTTVLVVKETVWTLKRILVCTAAREVDKPSIIEGVRLAEDAGAEVVVLYVADPVPGMYTGLNGMGEDFTGILQSNTTQAELLRWSKAYLKKSSSRGRLKLRRGVVINEIVREATEGEYDLVIIGAQTENNFWNELLVGNITGDIVELSPRSTMVIRTA